MNAQTPKIKTAVLISGRGSNMAALVNAAECPDYPAQISLVISNRPDAPGLDFAQEKGIAAQIIDHTDYSSRQSFDAALDKALHEAGIELVCCAGFMRILSPGFVHKWAGRIINIHPSLLPKYKGLHTHERALAAGDTEHGCTVHYVSAVLDGGDIIAQASLAIAPGDTPETLAARLLPLEHRLYADSLRCVAKQLQM